jgi:hypothetical protein
MGNRGFRPHDRSGRDRHDEPPPEPDSFRQEAHHEKERAHHGAICRPQKRSSSDHAGEEEAPGGTRGSPASYSPSV